MHKQFYASGFLFHRKTQQIHLYNRNEAESQGSNWQLIGADGEAGEESIDAFKRAVLIFTGISADPKKIKFVYDYWHEGMGKQHFIYYLEVGKLSKVPTIDNRTFSWFTFKQTLKLQFVPQTKQDITVAERVIRYNLIENHERTVMPTLTF